MSSSLLRKRASQYYAFQLVQCVGCIKKCDGCLNSTVNSFWRQCFKMASNSYYYSIYTGIWSEHLIGRLGVHASKTKYVQCVNVHNLVYTQWQLVEYNVERNEKLCQKCTYFTQYYIFVNSYE